ncbi:transcriptional regulator, AraC family [Rhodopseudomonas palustris HaA2]|uniref:Transcriptional regulator, AraC family n=1 Tax=Rhodopseudomonas palustris (strain HaA2) TaxID=316058 RepID=Q2J3R8_RHOP2|nr:AraC family transcriptional regulator [Rhodopseudomonas palustris]ABD04892.1 transcriptional regulator, AraC family [Rhodopseudomonas palustris HaA2]
MQRLTTSGDRPSTARAFVYLTQILQKAAETVERDPALARCCIERAVALLRDVQARHELIDEVPPETLDHPGLARWQLNRVVAHVEQNIDRSLRIRDLAQLIDLSASHFARVFRRSVGVAPRNFVLERRVARAKLLMQTSELPLSEVALACGLSDQAHLSRIFRRFTGMPPNAWRRQRRDRESQDDGELASKPISRAVADSQPSRTTRFNRSTGAERAATSKLA